MPTNASPGPTDELIGEPEVDGWTPDLGVEALGDPNEDGGHGGDTD